MRTPPYDVNSVKATYATGGCVNKYFTISRSDTVSGVKLTLPPSLIPIHATVQSQGAVSNAGTTAVVTLTGNATTIASFDVKTNKAQLVAVDAQPLLAFDKNDAQISAVYSETGTASSAGGPWLVTLECLAVGSV